MSNVPRKPIGCLAQAGRVLAVLIGLIVLLLVALTINQRIALARFRAATPPPGALFTVNGRQMHLHCVGSGAPTVVIDAGNASFSLEWTPIQAALSATARVCTYDRAGYGWSAPGPAPRDGAAAVADLHALLAAAGEQGPYLLVGHSLGGMHVRLFAARYPAEVAGLVLVDTAAEYTVTPELEAQMQASIGFYQVMRLLTGSGLLRAIGPLSGEGAMPETARKLPAELRGTYLNLLLDPQQHATAIAEMTALPATLRQTGEALTGPTPLGARPLIVLTAGQQMAPGATPFDNRRVPAPEAVIAAQDRLTALSARGEQRVVAESGHLMHLDAAEAVIVAVRDAIQMIREAP